MTLAFVLKIINRQSNNEGNILITDLKCIAHVENWYVDFFSLVAVKSSMQMRFIGRKKNPKKNNEICANSCLLVRYQ